MPSGEKEKKMAINSSILLLECRFHSSLLAHSLAAIKFGACSCFKHGQPCKTNELNLSLFGAYEFNSTIL